MALAGKNRSTNTTKCLPPMKKPSTKLLLRSGMNYLLRIGGFYLIAGFALAAQPDYNDHLTCAVYHRMLIGALKSKGMDQLTLADREQMQVQIELAKLAGNAEFEAFTETQFNGDWAEKFNLMTRQINSNYQNLYSLKARYKDQCKEL